ncbi:unnamed protein product [Heterobilharzia americana]|nr:unnamed protein product [Heterobilharzia americana]
MSGVCDNLVFENPLYTIDQKEILQALADAGLLNNEKLILEVVNQAINFAKTENFNFSHLCALVSVIDRVMKELSSSPYDDMQGVLGVADKMMLSYSIQYLFRDLHIVSSYFRFLVRQSPLNFLLIYCSDTGNFTSLH